MASKYIRNISKVLKSAANRLFGAGADGIPTELEPSEVRTLLSVSTTAETATLLADKADLVGGVIPSAQIPAIAITEYLGSVANQSAMLALTGDRGDWCLRSDTGTTWVLSDDDSSLLASWVELNYPTAPVTSVNGETGAVTLSAADVGAAATTLTITAGTGLSGGGDLSTNRTIDLENTAVTPGSYTATNLTVDAQGRITAASSGSGSGVGGSTGSTDNRVLRADGTGGSTLQSSAVTIDDSGNITGIVSEVISRGTNAGNAALTIGGSGGGSTRVNDNGTVLINGDVGTGTYPLKLQYNSSDRFLFGYLGELGLPVVGQPINLGQGVFHLTTASGNRSMLRAFVNLELSPGALGGGGTYVEINSGTAGTYRDLKCRDIVASGLICAGTYTVGTLPSASANAYKLATVSDSSVTTFGSTVAGGGSSKVQVYSNGTNWTVCAA